MRLTSLWSQTIGWSPCWSLSAAGFGGLARTAADRNRYCASDSEHRRTPWTRGWSLACKGSGVQVPISPRFGVVTQHLVQPRLRVDLTLSTPRPFTMSMHQRKLEDLAALVAFLRLDPAVAMEWAQQQDTPRRRDRLAELSNGHLRSAAQDMEITRISYASPYEILLYTSATVGLASALTALLVQISDARVKLDSNRRASKHIRTISEIEQFAGEQMLRQLGLDPANVEKASPIRRLLNKGRRAAASVENFGVEEQ